jgi:hypothetical protein
MNTSVAQDFTFSFRLPHHGVEARCQVQIYRQPGRAVVVVTELPDNPGVSVTNAAEYIATCILHDHALDPDTTIWVEHYHDRNRPGQHDPLFAESWDLVTFNWDYRTSPWQHRSPHATSPRWCPLDREEVDRLINPGGWAIDPPDDWYLEQEYEDRFYFPEDFF